MAPNQTLESLTSKVLIGISDLLVETIDPISKEIK